MPGLLTGKRLLIVAVCVSFLAGVLVPFERLEAQGKRPNALVVSYHPDATKVGLDILESGGNAFDAFVGATAAECVLAEGASSLAGSLGVVLYETKSKKVRYLDADFNDVKRPNGVWTAADPKPGKAILVPGTIAGLEALSKQYGRQSFSRVLQPAIQLAAEGFKINPVYASMVGWRAEVLRSSEYGRRTFFRNGQPLQTGDSLRQPEVASFLTHLAKEGSSYMYNGSWARQYVEAVRVRGGVMTADDLAAYRPAWQEPLRISYRGYEVYSCSARTFGGLWSLLALKTLEHTDIASRGRFSASAEALEVMVRTAREVWSETWMLDYRQLDKRELVESRLTSAYSGNLWARVNAALPKTKAATRGVHSYHIVVVDKDGNAVTGTHTFQSSPWGAGIFVEGIPLTEGGMLPYATQPGERRVSPFSMHLVLKDGKPRFATGGVSSSLIEASFQFLVSLIDYRLSTHEVVSEPRFGTFPHDVNDGSATPNWSSNWLDPRFGAELVGTLKKRGLYFQQNGGDTGFGAVAAMGPGGNLEGEVVPWFGLATPTAANRGETPPKRVAGAVR